MIKNFLILFCLILISPTTSHAAPSGGNVVAGNASISSNQTQTIINQLSNKAIINWNSFGIKSNESVQFIQPGSSSIALNRVIGTQSSAIYGQLTANGRIFLINPNGILFGAGSHIDVAGLVASTFNISDSDFLSGQYNFAQNSGNPLSYVINKGNITVAPNGFVYLVAPGVKNSGIIAAQSGQVALASGNQFTLDFSGDGLMQFAVSGQILQQIKDPHGKALSSAVSNTGTIQADGGSVLLTGDAANNVVSSVVNNGGIIEARSLGSSPGSVKLIGGSEGEVINTGTINTSAAVAGVSGGSIEMQGSEVGQFGTLLADAIDGNGGNINLYASDVLAFSNNSLTSANAGLTGNGGNVTAFSPGTTLFWQGAQIDAEGGSVSGNGGTVEVSGKQQDDVFGTVNTSAVNGNVGTLLIDPYNITISSGATSGSLSGNGNSGNPFEPTATSSVFNVSDLESDLNTTDITIETTSAGGVNGESGNIILANELDVTGAGHTLTLSAYNDININAPIVTTGGALNLVFTANNASTGSGNVNINATITTNGGSFTASGVNFTSAASDTINTGSGTISITQTGPVSIGAAISTTGTASISSSGGNITTGTSGSVSAGTLNLTDTGVGYSIGIGGTPFLTSATSIILNASTNVGNIIITNTTGSLVLGTLTTNGVKGTDTTSEIVLVADGTITTANTADTNIDAWATNLTTSSSGGGAIGAGGSPIVTNVDVLSATAYNGGIYISQPTTGSTPATLDLGTITAEAAGYSPVKNGSGLVQVDGATGTFNVSIIAGGNIILGGTISSPDLLTLTAGTGAIYNAYTGGTNFIAQTLSLSAGTAIGQSGGALETSVQTVNAAASAGGVYLTETDILTVGTITADGNVTITVDNGNLALGSITATGGVTTLTVGSAGNITDNTDGGSTNITGSGAVLSAGTGIGTSTYHVTTDVSALSATTTTASSPIYMSDTITPTSLTVSTDNSTVGISFTNGPLAFSSGNLSLGSTVSGLVLSFSNTGGSITLSGLNVGSGTVTLNASGAINQTGVNPIVAASATITAGTSIGSGTALLTDVNTLTLTATNGSINDTQSAAVTLTASASGTNESISVTSSSGNITIDSVTATGAVTIDAAASIINGNGSSTDITGASASLTAGSGSIGSSGSNNAINTHLAGALSATAHGDIYLSNLGNISQFDATATTGNISLINTGNVAIDAVSASASNKTITFNVTGTITDLNGLTDFAMGSGGTLNLTGQSIGTSGTPLLANVAELIALTTNGGIYLTQPDAGLTIDTVTAVGSSGSNVVILADGNIALGTITANGNEVILTSTAVSGAVTDDRTFFSLTADPNVTANQLVITAPGGIGTSGDALSFDVTHLTGSSAGDIYSDTVGPVLIDSSTFTGGGNNVTIDGQDITILDDSGGVMSTGGGNVTITADEGDVVFLNTSDTINAGGGNITITATWGGCSSGCADLLPGRVIVGNLTTSGSGTITINAYSDISIGNLTAGNSGTVTVNSTSGLILGNNPSTTTITAGTVNLTAVTPTPTGLANARADLVSAYDSKVAEAASELVLEDTWSSSYTELSTVAAEALATEATDQAAFNSIDAQLNSANSTLSSDQNTDEILSETFTTAIVVKDIAEFIAGAAQAIPFSGDAGADEIFAGVDTLLDAAQLAVVTYEHTTLADATDNAATLQSQDDVASANLTAATEAAENAVSNAAAADASLNIATQAYNASNVAAEHAAQTRVQAIDAAATVNAIGTSTYPLIVNAARININGTNTSAYITAPASTTIGIGTVSLPGGGLHVTSPSGGINVLGGPSSSPDAPTSVTLNATGDIIISSSGALATTDNGSIEVLTSGGVITTSTSSNTIEANGSGNVLLSADGNISLGGNVTSGTGNISLKAGSGISVAASQDITTGTPGTIYMNAAAGAITMNGTSNVTATGSSIMVHADGSVTLGNLTATNVSVLSDTGSILSGSGSTENLTATNVSLDADLAVGTSSAVITTHNVATISALASGGGIYLSQDAGAIAVGSVAVTVNDVNADGTTNTGAEVDAAQTDLTSGSNGAIVLMTTAGSITLDATTGEVSANGSGNILLSAGGASSNIVINDSVLSTTGNISLKAGDGITVAASQGITTGTGTVYMNAAAGTITMDGTSTVTATGSSLMVHAHGNITLGLLTASNISILSSAGSILSALDLAVSTDNLTATNVSLDADVAVGTSSAVITTHNVGTISALASGGGIYLTQDAGAIAVGSVAVTVNDVNANGTTNTGANVDAAQTDLTSGSNGNIVLTTTAGSITLDATNGEVSANGTGNILLSAGGASSNIAINDSVLSGTGNISLKAGDGITVAASQDITTGTTGTIYMLAAAGAITMDGTSSVTATSSSIMVHASGSVTLGLLTASNISVLSTTGSILSASDLTIDTDNVTATNLRLDADAAVGASSLAITTHNVATITALASDGGIYLAQDAGAIAVGSVSVTVNDVNADGTTNPSLHVDAAQTDLISSINGNIVLTTTAGSITLDANNGEVSANGTGNILLSAGGSSSNIAINDSVLSGTGNISLKAGDGITVAASQGITTATGTVYMNAAAGAITMDGTSSVTATSSSIMVHASGSVTLGLLTASNISILSTTGSILSASDLTVDTDNVTATNLRLDADLVIGTSSLAITTHNVATISALASGGGIYLAQDAGAIAVGSVTVTVNDVNANGTTNTGANVDAAQTDLTSGSNGNIVLTTTAGSITVDATNGEVSANGTGNILLSAGGASSNIVINDSVLSGTGNISLKAGDGITVAASQDITTATGTVYMNAALGAIAMNGTSNVTATGSSIMVHADGAVTLGNLTATNVSVLSDTGSILSGSGSTENVTATNLRLDADVAVGTSSAAITTHNVATISALASGGGIYLTQDAGAIAVGSVTVTVNDVNADGTTNTGANVDAAQTDLTSSSNGNIILTTVAGTITLDATNGEVSANGTGNILLSAGGASSNIVINDSVLSGTGNISLKAGDGITVAASQDITTATGTVYMNAAAGAITMNGTSNVTATGSSIMVHADGAVTLGNLTATNVSVLSETGSILNGSGSTENLTATNVLLAADVAIGTSSAAITTHNVATISASALGGGIYLSQDAGAIAVGSVAVTVNDVNTDGTTNTGVHADAAQTDLTSGSNGNIVLTTTAGSITLDASTGEVSANGSGNILLSAGGASSNIVINDSVLSGTGNISLKAGDGITVAASQDITTATGTVYMNAAAGAITIDGTSNVTATGSSIMVHADGTVTLGNLTATNVSVLSDTGSILSGSGSTENLTATNVRLDADVAVGTSSAAITTHNVATISALASGGGIYLSQDAGAITVGSVTVTVNDVNADGTTNTGANVDAAQTNLISGSNGAVVLITAAGSITLDAGNGEVSANGSGNILLSAGGASSNIVINDSVLSGTGNISLNAGDGITVAASQGITTATGTVYMNAAAGAITMDGTSNVTATGASLMLHANGTVTLGNLTATNVSVLSDTGSILNGSGSTENLTATNVRLDADAAVGTSSAAITTHNVGTISALASGDAIYLSQDAGAIAVGSVAVTVNDVNTDGTTNTGANVDAAQTGLTSGSNGNIILTTTAGGITLNSGSGAVSANGSGNVLLSAGGSTSDVTANAAISSGSGDITVLGGRSVISTSGANITTTGGDIDLEAALGSITMDADSLFSAGSGNIRLLSNQDVTLGGLSTTGNVSLTATNGSILNAGNTDYVNVSANDLRLSAGNGIGTSTNAIDTTINTVSGRASAGGINILDNSALTVDDVQVAVQKIAADGTTNTVTDTTQSDLRTTSGGSITVQTSSGDITLNDGTAPADNTAISSTGNVTLLAAGSVIQNADITASGSNNISVTAGSGNITTSSGTTTSTGTGTVSLTANNGTINTNTISGGSVNLNAGSITNTNGGSVTSNSVVVTSPSVSTATLKSLVGGGSGYESITFNSGLVAGQISDTVILVPLSALNSNLGSVFNGLSLQEIINEGNVNTGAALILQL